MVGAWVTAPGAGCVVWLSCGMVGGVRGLAWGQLLVHICIANCVVAQGSP